MELPDSNEIWVMVGGAFAAFLAGIFGYFRRPKASNGNSAVFDPVIGGVGLELGNRKQVDSLIHETKRVADELKRIADAMTDAKADEINDRLDEQTKVIEQLGNTVEGLLRKQLRQHKG